MPLSPSVAGVRADLAASRKTQSVTERPNRSARGNAVIAAAPGFIAIENPRRRYLRVRNVGANSAQLDFAAAGTPWAAAPFTTPVTLNVGQEARVKRTETVWAKSASGTTLMVEEATEPQR